MDIAGCSTAGPRPQNEDNFYYRDFDGVALLNDGIMAFALVCDGMGGHSAGDVASRVACEEARSYIDSLVEMAHGQEVQLEVEAALQEMVSRANQAVINTMQQTGSSSMGTTFVGAFLSSTTAWIAHVGDSRAYRIRDGQAELLTRDHSVVGRMLADGLLTEEQAQEHPERNVIERALGFNGDEAEIDTVALNRGDALVFCTDGVSTVLSSEQLGFAASQAGSVADAAQAVVRAALDNKTDDNATALFVTPSWRTFKARAPKISKLQMLRMKTSRKGDRKLFGQPLILAIAGGLMLAIIIGVLVASQGATTAGTGSSVAASLKPGVGGSSNAADTSTTQPTGTTVKETMWQLSADAKGAKEVWVYYSKASAPTSVTPLKYGGKNVSLTAESSFPGTTVQPGGTSSAETYIKISTQFWKTGPVGPAQIVNSLNLPAGDFQKALAGIGEVDALYVLYKDSASPNGDNHLTIQQVSDVATSKKQSN